ncbi:permease, partial [filamentous cyanobacterium CCP3]
MGSGLILALVGLLAGVLAGFLGIGGGTGMVPVMVALGMTGV